MWQLELRVQIPEKLIPGIYEPRRYKVLYGGRGSAKSWSVARVLAVMAGATKKRVLCGRETQKSIAESVHHLIASQIQMLGLSGFEVQEQRILHRRLGSEFVFAGFRQQGIANIKSFEDVDVCWIEEGQTLTKRSREILTPTIRKPGSEVWVSMNPELETDDAYQFFVEKPPASAWVCQINYADNPWFTAELEAERLDTLERDPDGYQTIWLGKCRQAVSGAIYAREIQAASDRIAHVPHDPLVPVHTWWDLGIGDDTAIWLVQFVGSEIRVIDYVSGNGQRIDYYIKELQSRGFVWGDDWLPHDAQARELGTGQSIEEIVKGYGRSVRIAPKLSLEDGINATRMIFPRLWFDKEKCADGIQALRHYRWRENTRLREFQHTPEHDWASHAADALRYLAVSVNSVSMGRPAPKINYRTRLLA